MSRDNIANNKRITKNSIFLSIRMLFVLFLTLYTTRAILSLLGVEDYGVYNVVSGFVSMFVFLNTSMSNGIQRFYNFELGKNGIAGAKRVYNVALITQLILSVLIIILVESFGIWYLQNKMVIPEARIHAAEWIFQLSVLGFFFVIVQAPYSAAVMAHEKMDFFALVSIIDAILKLMIVFVIPLFSFDYLISYGILLTSVNFINLILYFVYCKRNFVEISFERKQPIILYKSMLAFSGWNIFGSLSSVLKEQGINIIMNLFFGPVVNAARGVAYQVNSGLISFVQNITIPARPQVIQSYAQGEINRTMRLTYSISKLSTCLLYLISLPILIEINYLLRIWLSDNIPEHTASFVLIIVLTTLFSNLNYSISGVVHASGKMMLYQIVGGGIGILSVPIAYVSLLMGGSPESALWVVFASMFISQVGALLVLKTIIQYSILDYLKSVILPIVFLIAVSIWIPILPHNFMEESMLRLIVVTILSVLPISVFTYFIVLDKGERALIKQMITTWKIKIK